MRQGLSARIVGLSIRRPWPVIAVWFAVVALLSFIGSDIKSVLKVDDYTYTNSRSARALELIKSEFGRSEVVAIMLASKRDLPKNAGLKIVRAAGKVKSVKVVDPWTQPSLKGLHPRKGKAVIVAFIDRPVKQAGEVTVPILKIAIERSLPNGVKVSMTGNPLMVREYLGEAVNSAKRAELLAAPVLLILLLLVFRSPLAAMLPLAVGLSVTQMGTGFTALVARVTDVDPSALNSLSILGLALGVDYSLLVVSRFREELARKRPVREAVVVSRSTAGSTAAVAGFVVIGGMAILYAFVPTVQIRAAAAGIVSAAMLAVLASLTVLPALLTVAGARINSWMIGRRTGAARTSKLVLRLISRPALAALVTLIPLLFLSYFGVNLKRGLYFTDALEPDNRLYQETQAIANVMGDGWSEPYEVVIHSGRGPLTSKPKLEALSSLQRALAQDAAVASVVGPAAITPYAQSASQAARNGEEKLERLDTGLGLAFSGTRRLREGLNQARMGSAQLAAGADAGFFGSQKLLAGINQAQAGLASLQGGLARTASGSQSLTAGLSQLRAGAASLRSAAYAASQGASSLQGPSQAFKDELSKGQAELEGLKVPPQEATAALQQAKSALDGFPLPLKADPQFQAAYQALLTAQANLTGYDPLGGSQQLQAGYYGLAAAIERASASSQLAAQQAQELANGADELGSGVDSLASGTGEILQATSLGQSGADRLAQAIGRVRQGTARLSAGGGALAGGANSLKGGLSELRSGAGRLASGLQGGHKSSGKLSRGVGTMRKEIGRARDGLNDTRGELNTKRIAGSGYLTLAALDGASPKERQSVGLVLNTDKGGDTARLYVLPKQVSSKRWQSGLPARLDSHARAFGKAQGLSAYVGGRGAMYDRYRQIVESKLVPTMLVATIVSLLLLILIFHSLLLALKAVLLNLLTVGAAFGVIALLSHGENPILGGAGYAESGFMVATYIIIFVISMDYEVFLINRMREAYRATGSTELAIREGVIKTAGVVTGAAAIMASVFFIFTIESSLVAISQMTAGLMAAIVIDATIVRLVLLPATMRLFGAANWWLPGWLERRLPKVDTA